MPIDFFVAPCALIAGNCRKLGIVCANTTKSTTFGICDDPPPADTPAYLKFHSSADWIAEVDNQNAKEITFKAIDNCVKILRANGDLECRCDGMLCYDVNVVIFVELKDRTSKGWLSKGRQQLTITIGKFAENHPSGNYQLKEAYVCNKQRPLAITSTNSEVQKFKDDTSVLLGNVGLLLRVERKIEIR